MKRSDIINSIDAQKRVLDEIRDVAETFTTAEHHYPLMTALNYETQMYGMGGKPVEFLRSMLSARQDDAVLE